MIARTLIVGVCLALGGLALGGAALGNPAGTDGPAGASAASTDSPHAHPDRCAACHRAGADSVPTMDTCRSCHPTADMHPVGIAPEATTLPAGWPLEDGGIACATCHAEPACDVEREQTRPWLRGGVPDRITTFCTRCHTGDGLKRIDPHHPDAALGTEDPSCASCHTAVPAPGASPEAAELRSSPSTSCAVCHDGEHHPGAAEHLGVSSAPSDPPLPLDGDRVRCWTCHDVHAHRSAQTPRPRGPRARAAAATLRALLTPASEPDPEHPPLLALPAEDDALCRACHGGGP